MQKITKESLPGNHITIDGTTTEVNIRSAVLFYHGLGFPTVPTKDKIPLYKGWKETQTPSKYPDNYWKDYERTNEFLVVLQKHHLCIDIDPRHFPKINDVVESSWSAVLSALKLTQEDFFPTLVVTTPRGGQHVYLIKPAEIAVKHVLKEYPGLEFKSFGRYVIGAGSVTSFGIYAVNTACLEPSSRVTASPADPVSVSIKPCPPALLAFIEKRANPALVDTVVEYYDTTDNIEQFVEFVRKHPGAVEGNRGDETTYIIACRGRAFGLSPEITMKILLDEYNPKCIPSWTEEELYTKVKNAYAYDTAPQGEWCPEKILMRLRNEEVKHYEHQQKKQIDLNTLPGADNRIADIGNVIRFDLDRRGFKTKTLNNCVLFCRTDTGLCAAVRYNLFSNAIEIIRPLPWHCNRASTLPVWVDEDTLLLKLYLANRTQLEFSTVTCFEAITATALINPVHPVREYLSGLKWDGMPRLETWLTKIAECADTEYTRMVQSLLIRAAVNRVLRPGCKYDHMVILESVQGAGKSRLVSVLGGAWYSDAFIDPGSRDTVDQIQGKWFVEIPEMKMVGSDDVDSIKAFITRQTDRARLAYARITRDYPRQCVFVGTINPLEVGYLKDETGNRRFLPVWCGSEHFNLSWLEDNRDQLFAEAVKKAGEPIWIMEKLEGDAQAEVDRRMIQDPYYEIISNYLKLNPNKNALSTVMVYETILGGAPKNMKRLDQMRIGRVLRSLGYVRRYIRTNRYTGTIYEKVGCREPDPIKLVKTSGWEQKEESIIDEEALGGLEGVFE